MTAMSPWKKSSDPITIIITPANLIHPATVPSFVSVSGFQSRASHRAADGGRTTAARESPG